MFTRLQNIGGLAMKKLTLAYHGKNKDFKVYLKNLKEGAK